MYSTMLIPVLTLITVRNSNVRPPINLIHSSPPFKYDELTNVTINLGSTSLDSADGAVGSSSSPGAVAATGATFWTVVVAFICLLVGLGIGFRLGKQKYKKYKPGTKTESFGGI